MITTIIVISKRYSTDWSQQNTHSIVMFIIEVETDSGNINTKKLFILFLGLFCIHVIKIVLCAISFFCWTESVFKA